MAAPPHEGVRAHTFGGKAAAATSGRATLVGFATDHGVHTAENGRGSHGKDIPEDIEITHFYDFI